MLRLLIKHASAADEHEKHVEEMERESRVALSQRRPLLVASAVYCQYQYDTELLSNLYLGYCLSLIQPRNLCLIVCCLNS
jgi:hypothetical protein